MLKSGDPSVHEVCLKRLNYLDELFQNVGTEEEWFDTIMEDEYALAATVYDYLVEDCPREIRETVCRLLVRMSKLDPQISVMIMSERWGDLSFLMAQVSTGISLALNGGSDVDEELQMQSLFAWFLLVSQLFTATQDFGIPEEVLPQAAFFGPTIQAMEDCTEDVFLLACEACLAINIHYENRDTNQFMIALMAAEEVRVFVFAVVVQGLRF